jgi:hypothetical protein
VASGAEIEVRRLAADDALGLAACLSRCYGDGYPKRVLYQPDEAASLIRSGAYAGVVAVTGDGEVVGHIGFSRPSPNATVVEAGTTIVDPVHRGEGLMGRMALQLGSMIRADGIAGVIQFPTTAHQVMQRAATIEGRETGVLLAYIPSSTRLSGGGGRLAVTVVYQDAHAGWGQTVFLPERYQARLQDLAEGAGLEREIAYPRPANSGPSRLRYEVDEARSLLRVSVRSAGGNLGHEVVDLITSLQPALVHVDLAMDDPGIGSAVEALSAQHFAYGAWLPGWSEHDVLRMQHIAEPTDEELHPDLYTPEAQSLCASIRTELAADI